MSITTERLRQIATIEAKINDNAQWIREKKEELEMEKQALREFGVTEPVGAVLLPRP